MPEQSYSWSNIWHLNVYLRRINQNRTWAISLNGDCNSKVARRRLYYIIITAVNHESSCVSWIQTRKTEKFFKQKRPQKHTKKYILPLWDNMTSIKWKLYYHYQETYTWRPKILQVIREGWRKLMTKQLERSSSSINPKFELKIFKNFQHAFQHANIWRVQTQILRHVIAI